MYGLSQKRTNNKNIFNLRVSVDLEITTEKRNYSK